jgi:tryptophanase
MFAHSDPVTGEMIYPKLELVRLAIPRRVYTQRHLDYVASTCTQVYAQRQNLRGLRIVKGPALLRHFLCELEII